MAEAVKPDLAIFVMDGSIGQVGPRGCMTVGAGGVGKGLPRRAGGLAARGWGGAGRRSDFSWQGGPSAGYRPLHKRLARRFFPAQHLHLVFKPHTQQHTNTHTHTHTRTDIHTPIYTHAHTGTHTHTNTSAPLPPISLPPNTP